MSENDNNLLKPSIGKMEIARAPYSVTTCFMVGFLGGFFAALAILLANSARLNRLNRDALVLGAATFVYLAVFAFLAWTEQGGSLLAAVKEMTGERGLRYMIQVFGVILCGVGYLLHYKEQRSTDYMGLDRPSPWVMGIVCVVIGGIVQIAVVLALFKNIIS